MSHRVHRISELISHDELCRRISYNPETGETFWRVGNGRRVKAGDFGYFSTKEEAREARRMGDQSLFGEFSRAS